MKENQKDSKSQINPKGQQQNQNDNPKHDNAKQNKPLSKDGKEDEDEEGTKMPGRETRTPVAGEKTTTQKKNQSGNKGK